MKLVFKLDFSSEICNFGNSPSRYESVECIQHRGVDDIHMFMSNEALLEFMKKTALHSSQFKF